MDAVAEVETPNQQGDASQDVGTINHKSKRFFSGKKLSAKELLQKIVKRKKKEFKRASGSAVMSFICSLGALSFRAYEDPVAAGFDEVTVTGNRIRHLNYDVLNDAVDGVLKIHLDRARNVLDADIFAGKSDPYVVFSTGWSQVASETKQNEDNPVWNSDHYLLLRKPGVVQRDTECLTVSMFDSDTARGRNAERNFRQRLIRDDFLGSATVNIADFKKPGVHSQELTLHLEGDRRPEKTTILLSIEFLTFEEACKQLGKEKASNVWIHNREEEPQDETTRWTTLTSVNDEVDRILFQRIAFINAVNTGTQVWIHVNAAEKKIAIAFRGTESTRVKDLLTDLKFLSTRLTWAEHAECSLKLRDIAQQHRIRVHSGFRTAYASVWSSILTVVEQVSRWSSDWTIYATGHSLGGALATLCAFEFANRINDVGDGPRIVMMNFGAPRVGNKEFVRVYCTTVAESYRVINRLDIIHRLPRLMKHVPREVSLEEDGDIVIDKLQSIKKEMHSQTDDEEGEHLQTHHPEKLTRKSIVSLPGFKGHFENYYFDMVAMATKSIFEGAQSHVSYLLGELKEVVSGVDELAEQRPTTTAGNASNTKTCPLEAPSSSQTNRDNT